MNIVAKWLFAMGLMVTLIGAPIAVRAEEPDGLAAVAAIQDAMVNAIARSEKSVVAIGRVKRETGGNPMFEDRTEVGVRFSGETTRPTDANFVFHDYGAGVVVDASGLILTNIRLCDPDSDLYVTTPDRKTRKAIIKATDPRSELAILSIGSAEVTPIRLGDADKLKKGQIVISLGNPYTIARDGQPSASWGIISNLGRQDHVEPNETGNTIKRTFSQLAGLIQTDAKLHHGTTGGALINLQGEMIGLTTTLETGQGVETSSGYAIPVNRAFKRVLESLKSGREVEYGLLGIQPTDEVVQTGGVPGVKITDVIRGTPAEQADLRPNSDVITEVDGRAVETPDQLIMQISSHAPGERVQLSVLREKKIVPVSVKLVKAYIPGPRVVTSPAPSWRGVTVDYSSATPVLSQLPRFGGRGIESSFGEKFDPEGCVAVTAVEEGSPAFQAGLRPHEYLSHVAGNRVTTPQEFYDAVDKLSGSVEVRIPGAQGRVEHFLVPPEKE
jgi:serine protease Do